MRGRPTRPVQQRQVCGVDQEVDPSSSGGQSHELVMGDRLCTFLNGFRLNWLRVFLAASFFQGWFWVGYMYSVATIDACPVTFSLCCDLWPKPVLQPPVRQEACQGLYKLCLGRSSDGEMGYSFLLPVLASLLVSVQDAQNMKSAKRVGVKDEATGLVNLRCRCQVTVRRASELWCLNAIYRFTVISYVVD